MALREAGIIAYLKGFSPRTEGFGRADLIKIGWFFTFEVTFYFAYHYGMSFSQATASPFWFPDAILLCALLRTSPRYWWIFVIGPLPIRLFSEVAQDVPLWMLLATYVIDSAKGLVAAFALRRFVANPLHLDTTRDFAIFVLIAVLLVPAASAFAGAAVRAVLGYPFWQAWGQWFLGDALAQLVLAPAILYLLGGLGPLLALSWSRRIEAVLSIGGLIVTGYLASHTEHSSTLLAEPRFYAPILFLFWTAIRFGMFGAGAAVVILAFLFVEAAARGAGPFSDQSPGAVASTLQNFLFPRAMVLYLVALSTEQTSRAQNFIRESEERFRMVANSSPVLLWMSGRDKSCDFFNDTWLKFTGRPLAAELGDGWVEGVHAQDKARCMETYISSFDARQPFEMEYRLRRHDGQYRWILDLGVPRYATNGDFVGYIGSAMDITERKRAEELSGTLAHLQRISMIGALSAAIAHEIRQPLYSIVMNASAATRMLNSDNPPVQELREIMYDIREDTARTTDVITRTRDLASKRKPRMTSIDINAVISDVICLMAAEAVHRSTRFRAELGSNLPLVSGDRTQLQQVILNLAVNGLDAMMEKPEFARELIIQSQATEQGTIEIAVIDRGSGIPSDELPHLFEPFSTTKETGLGLGLFVSQTIIEAHQGRIWAQNNSHGGLSVHFALPTLEGEAADAVDVPFADAVFSDKRNVPAEMRDAS